MSSAKTTAMEALATGSASPNTVAKVKAALAEARAEGFRAAREMAATEMRGLWLKATRERKAAFSKAEAVIRAMQDDGGEASAETTCQNCGCRLAAHDAHGCFAWKQRGPGDYGPCLCKRTGGEQ